MIMEKGMIHRLSGMMLIILISMALTMGNALADESAIVNIPVVAHGADCRAILLNKDNAILQVLQLKDGVESSFSVECHGLFQHQYTIRLDMQDTPTIKYDHKKYTVTIDLFYDVHDDISYLITASDGSTIYKQVLTFENTDLTPTPTPTPSPTPVPTATPVPYTYQFTFTKLWQGSHEDSIDWVLYRADGSVLHKKFNKYYISENEWYYEAWFNVPVDDCYLMETAPNGYKVRYENVGAHAGETDRCYNGGTIINYKVPKTGDASDLRLWLVCVLLGVSAVCGTLAINRRKKRKRE